MRKKHPSIILTSKRDIDHVSLAEAIVTFKLHVICFPSTPETSKLVNNFKLIDNKYIPDKHLHVVFNMAVQTKFLNM